MIHERRAHRHQHEGTTVVGRRGPRLDPLGIVELGADVADVAGQRGGEVEGRGREREDPVGPVVLAQQPVERRQPERRARPVQLGQALVPQPIDEPVQRPVTQPPERPLRGEEPGPEGRHPFGGQGDDVGHQHRARHAAGLGSQQRAEQREARRHHVGPHVVDDGQRLGRETGRRRHHERVHDVGEHAERRTALPVADVVVLRPAGDVVGCVDPGPEVLHPHGPDLRLGDRLAEHRHHVSGLDEPADHGQLGRQAPAAVPLGEQVVRHQGPSIVSKRQRVFVRSGSCVGLGCRAGAGQRR